MKKQHVILDREEKQFLKHLTIKPEKKKKLKRSKSRGHRRHRKRKQQVDEQGTKIDMNEINMVMGMGQESKKPEKKEFKPKKDVKKQNLLQFAMFQHVKEMIDNTSGNISPLQDNSDVSMMFKNKSNQVNLERLIFSSKRFTTWAPTAISRVSRMARLGRRRVENSSKNVRKR